MLAQLDQNGNFYADPVMVNNLVFTRLGKSIKEIEKYLNELVEKDLILIYEVDGERYLNYPDFFEKQPNIRPDREGKTDIPNHTPDSIRIDSGSISGESGLTPPEYKRREEKRIYSQVIDYLNQKSGSDYKARSKGTQRHIDARVNEGYTLDDFKAVIDGKVSQWTGDPKMNKYLRPETLFGPKFESYLNERPRPKPTSETQDDLEAQMEARKRAAEEKLN